MWIKDKKGSLTVEAALVLPVFISAVLTIAFLIKMVYTHEVIQHAITETANEMAAYSYIYHISGLQDIHDTTREGMNEKGKIFDEHMSTVFDTFQTLGGTPGKLVDNIQEGKELEESTDLFKNAYDSFKKTVDIGKGVAKNPLEELKSAASAIASGAFDDAKTQLCIPLVRYYMEKHLSGADGAGVEERAKRLNISGGIEGLDFSESRFYEDGSNDIDIIVKYKMSIPVPFKFLPKLCVVQRAAARAWVGGDDEGGSTIGGGDGGEEDSVWSLGSKERGQKIKEAFGSNLPDKFPVIDAFDAKTGEATRIRSMDITTRYYSYSRNVSTTLRRYINELSEFRGGKYNGVEVKENQVEKKLLKLVIPENDVRHEVDNAIEACKIYAVSMGIKLEVIKYQTKKMESGEK